MLGCLAQFLHLAAFYLDGPLLHTLGLQGSTSSLWVPRSFWEAGPPTENAVHHLHIRSGAHTAAAAPCVPPFAQRSHDIVQLHCCAVWVCCMAQALVFLVGLPERTCELAVAVRIFLPCMQMLASALVYYCSRFI